MKRILITGASGFIGGFLVEEALSKNWETWAGIRKTSNRNYLQDPSIQFIDLHLADKEKLKRQLSEQVNTWGKWDYIVHNAGITKCLDPADFDKINHLFTRHFVEALQEINAVPEKFVYMSSLSAHAECRTAYGTSKLKAEHFLEKQTDFPYIIICPTGVYGPRDKDYFLMIKSLKTGWDIAAGMETQKLTFIYVKDLVRAVFLALTSDLSGKSYTVAEEKVYTDKEYTAIVKEALGKKIVLSLRIPLPVLKVISALAEDFSKWTQKPSTLNRDKYKIMAQRDWTCDVEPIYRDLNFRTEYDLKRGIRESVEWYRANGWL